MIIGELRSRITIEQLSDTPDGIGGKIRTWSTLKTLWAYIEPANASERYFAQRVEDNITHKVLIRYTTGLDTSMRIVYKTRKFQIKGLKEVENKHRFIEISCMEDSGT